MSDAQSRIADIVNKNDIVLFMKGTALFPQCGFSSRAIAILDRLGAKYETVDVLQDPEIRAGIKDYSDWPTVPQLYVKGEFVGGSDIMMEMFESGELQQMVGAERLISSRHEMRKGRCSRTREPLHRPFIGVEPSGRDICSNRRAKSKKWRISAVLCQQPTRLERACVKNSDILRGLTAVGTLAAVPC